MEELLNCSAPRQTNRGIQTRPFPYSIGPPAVKTYISFDLSEDDKHHLDAIIVAFDKYVIGETSETFERYLFNRREQREGESIDPYVVELRILAQSCNFCDCLHDFLIRDKIVLGTRKGLLREQKLTLTCCTDIDIDIEVKRSLRNTDQITRSVR